MDKVFRPKTETIVKFTSCQNGDLCKCFLGFWTTDAGKKDFFSYYFVSPVKMLIPKHMEVRKLHVLRKLQYITLEREPSSKW